jgi:CheY-like chemotaxis protein
MERNGQQFTQTIRDRPLYLEADPMRLAQAVSNVLNNAAKYTPPGGSVSLVVEKQGDGIAITVADTGIGIAPEMLSCIFDMFTQIGKSVERSNGGLGIGLALTRRIVELHGGTITAASEGSNRGSCFTIRVPLAAESAHADGTGAMAEASSRPPMRVLLVDDNRDVTETLGALLEMTGNAVQCAFDGEQALDLAESFKPDVVLLDIGLPKVGGWEVAERLRRRPWAKDVVLVAISGRSSPADIERSNAAGFSRHLVKPVTASAVLEVLSSLPKTAAVPSAS